MGNENDVLHANQLTDQTISNYLPDNAEAIDHAHAGFWLRFLAYLIDVIVVFSIKGFLLSPFKFMNEGFPIDIGFWTVNGLLGMTTFYLYFLLMTKGFNQTIGKMILRIQVVKEDGSKLGWSDLIFREVIGRFIHNVIFILKLLYIVVAFTKEKQGIHDMIGNTVVVKV